MDTVFSSGNIEAIKGGAIMALGCSIAYVLIGKLIGMSSIIGALARCKVDQFFKTKMALLSGILFATGVIYTFSNLQNKYLSVNRQKPEVYLVAGFLVGFGTRMAGGCTSGHGLLGLPRLSLKSVVAVLTFLSVAILTATFHLEKYIPTIGLNVLDIKIMPKLSNYVLALFLIGISLVVLLLSYIPSQNEFSGAVLIERTVLFVTGGIFAFGLLISGMVSRDKVHNFLDFKGAWDPSLLFVMATGVILNFLSFQFIINRKKSLLDYRIENPQGPLSIEAVVGSALFGLGWGLGSMCPGPVYVALTVFEFGVHGMWIIGALLGAFVYFATEKIKKQ